MLKKIKFKKGDLVVVGVGKDKGRKGKILKVFPKVGKVVVEKVNFVKRHQKPTKEDPQGGVREKEAPINASNAKLVCPKCGKVTRIGFKVADSGEKFRICVKCKETL